MLDELFENEVAVRRTAIVPVNIYIHITLTDVAVTSRGTGLAYAPRFTPLLSNRSAVRYPLNTVIVLTTVISSDDLTTVTVGLAEDSLHETTYRSWTIVFK